MRKDTVFGLCISFTVILAALAVLGGALTMIIFGIIGLVDHTMETSKGIVLIVVGVFLPSIATLVFSCCGGTCFVCIETASRS